MSPYVLVGMIWVLILAFLARHVVVLTDQKSLSKDRDLYLEIGEQIARGNGWCRSDGVPTAYRPPLYPYLVAKTYYGWGPGFFGFTQVLLGTLTVWMTMSLAISLGFGSWSLLAGLLVACDPLHIQSTKMAMTEVFSAFLISYWLVLCQKPDRSSRTLFKMGLLWGLNCLCRPFFLLTAPFFGLQLLFASWKKKSLPGFSLWIAVITGGLVLAPWIIRNGLVLGVPTPATTHGGYTIHLGNNEVFYSDVVQKAWGTTWSDSRLSQWKLENEFAMAVLEIAPQDEVRRDHWHSQRAWDYITQHPWQTGQAALWRIRRLFDISPHGPAKTELSQPVLWGIRIWYSLQMSGLFVGLFLLRNRPMQIGLLALVLTHLLYWTDMRMRAPVLPIIALFSTAGLRWAFGSKPASINIEQTVQPAQ